MAVKSVDKAGSKLSIKSSSLSHRGKQVFTIKFSKEPPTEGSLNMTEAHCLRGPSAVGLNRILMRNGEYNSALTTFLRAVSLFNNRGNPTSG